MRNIKFRGKRLDNGEWVYGNLIINQRDDEVYIGVYEPAKKSRNLEWSVYEVDPETVGQFTEILDKNGVAIYEGDIVKDDYGVGVVSFILEHCAYIVKTVNPSQYHYLLSDGQLHNTEVIGNFHENPELLENTNVEG